MKRPTSIALLVCLVLTISNPSLIRAQSQKSCAPCQSADAPIIVPKAEKITPEEIEEIRNSEDTAKILTTRQATLDFANASKYTTEDSVTYYLVPLVLPDPPNSVTRSLRGRLKTAPTLDSTPFLLRFVKGDVAATLASDLSFFNDSDMKANFSDPSSVNGLSLRFEDDSAKSYEMKGGVIATPIRPDSEKGNAKPSAIQVNEEYWCMLQCLKDAGSLQRVQNIRQCRFCLDAIRTRNPYVIIAGCTYCMALMGAVMSKCFAQCLGRPRRGGL